MTIITAAGLSDLYNQRAFNKNGSSVTLKKISETEWILFGDLAEGDSEGFGDPPPSCNINLELTYPWGDSREPGLGFLLQIPYEAGDWLYPWPSDGRFQPPLDIYTNGRVLLNYERDNPSNNYGSLPNGAPSFIKTLTLQRDNCGGEMIVWFTYDPGQMGPLDVSLMNMENGNTEYGSISGGWGGGTDAEPWLTGSYLSYSEYSGASFCLNMYPRALF